jgi:putative inorganic carbon (HCO3(-)) transporter
VSTKQIATSAPKTTSSSNWALANSLNFFSFFPYDHCWQQTVKSSRLWTALVAVGALLHGKVQSNKFGSYVLTLSFATTLLLFIVLPLPQFASDKEGLAVLPLIGMSLWLLGNMLGGKEHRPATATDALVILFIGINLLATVSSHYFFPSLKGLSKMLVYASSYFLMSNQLTSHPRRKLWLIIALVAVGTLVAAYGLYQYKIGVAPLATWEDPNVENKTVRIYSTLLNPNLLAGYLVPLVPLSMSLAVAALVNKQLWLSLPASGCTFILITATFLSGSRGGYLGMIASIAAFGSICAGWLWHHQRKARPYIVTIAFLLPVLCFVVVKALPSFEQRFASIFAGREHSSNSFRMNVWLSSLAMLRDNWWLGIGVGNQAFVLAYGLYMHAGFDALGTYCVPLEVAVETGAAGLLIFVLILIAALCRGHISFWCPTANWQRWLTAGVSSAMIGLIIHGLVDTVFYRPQVQFIFWLTLAILLSLPQPDSGEPFSNQPQIMKGS